MIKQKNIYQKIIQINTCLRTMTLPSHFLQTREICSQSYQIKPKSDRIYHAPIDL